MTLAEILGQVVLPSLAAMGAGIGGGLVYAKRNNGKPTEPRTPTQYRSLPPAAPTQAAPAALTTTARHELDGSLGRMRCDGHGELVAGQTGTVTEVRELRREVRDGFESIGERLEKLLEWKGGIDARALALERDVGRLNSMARGGLTPRRVDP